MDVLRLDVLTWAAEMKETHILSKLLALERQQGTERYHSGRETLQGKQTLGAQHVDCRQNE